MKASIVGVAVGSFALGALLTLTAGDVLARSAAPAKPSVYTDARYNFTISPPNYPKGEKDTSGLSASFFGPGKKGFAPNLGIMIQNVAMSAQDYADLSNGQFKEAGFKVVSQTDKKVSGRDAILWEYEGKAQNRELTFYGLAVCDKERIYLITATAPKSEWDTLGPELKASIDSFSLGE